MADRWSVVVATRDGASFIEEQLRSILDQTRPPDEILVGDDASDDETADIVSRVASRHPMGDRVRMRVRPRALGLVDNFGDLIRSARGDLIALSDQDDRWVPERLETLTGRLSDQPGVLLLHHDAWLIDAHGSRAGSLFDALRIGPELRAEESRGFGYDVLLRRNTVTGATAVLRRPLVDLAGAVPPGWIHDEWLAIVAAALDGLGIAETRLIEYRQHGANQIGATALDAGTVLRRFREDGVRRNARLLLRAESLAATLPRIPGVPSSRIAMAQDKVAHERARGRLPRTRIGRLPAVVREWRTGRYAAYGNGAPDAARDLIQPLREAR